MRRRACDLIRGTLKWDGRPLDAEIFQATEVEGNPFVKSQAQVRIREIVEMVLSKIEEKPLGPGFFDPPKDYTRVDLGAILNALGLPPEPKPAPKKKK